MPHILTKYPDGTWARPGFTVDRNPVDPPPPPPDRLFPTFNQANIDEALVDVQEKDPAEGCFIPQKGDEYQAEACNAAMAMHFLALVAWYYPLATGSNGESVAERVAACVRCHTAAGTETGTPGLYPWAHTKTASVIALARHNPAVWELLSLDVQERAEWWMRANAVVGNLVGNSAHEWYLTTDLSRGGGYLPNQRGTASIMTSCYLYFGSADAVNAVLADFVFDTYVAKFQSFGWTRILEHWTDNPLTKEIMEGRKTDYQSGPHKAFVTSDGVTRPFDFRGRIVSDPDTGTRSAGPDVVPYTPFNLFRREEAEFMYGCRVKNVCTSAAECSSVVGQLMGTSAYTGDLGMAYEFNVLNERSDIHYVWSGNLIALPHYSMLVAMGYWQYDNQTYDLIRDQVWTANQHIFDEAGVLGWKVSGGQGRCGRVLTASSFWEQGWKYQLYLWDAMFRQKLKWDVPSHDVDPLTLTLTAQPAEGAVDVSWAISDASQVASWLVARDGPDGGWSTIDPASARSRLFTNLTPGTEYTFTITARNSSGATLASETVTAVPKSSVIPPSEGETPWLPFDMPSRQARAAITERVVLAHWFNSVFPKVVNTLPPSDYWDDYWMPPGATEGGKKNYEYGGYVRERKRWEGAAAGDSVGNFKLEIGEAIDAGLDGFFTWMGTDRSNSQRYGSMKKLYQASEELGDPYFLLSPMPDGNTTSTVSVNECADYLDELWTRGAKVWRINGRPVLAPYGPEFAPLRSNVGPSFWSDVLSRLRNTHGHDPLFWGCYSSGWNGSKTASGHQPFAYGHGRWGNVFIPGHGDNLNSSTDAPTYCLNTYGKPWMGFVMRSYDRPRVRLTHDPHGMIAMDTQWKAWINDPSSNTRCVQIVTWDDYHEGSQMSPTSDAFSGRAWADLNAYYSMWYKFRTPPTILRDGIYLANRRQVVGSSANQYPSTQIKFQTEQGYTPRSNLIEARVFCTAPATLEILVDGAVRGSWSVPAGMSSHTIPAELGLPSARLVRSLSTVASVTSNHEIVTDLSDWCDDRMYNLASSYRQALGQV